MISIIVAVAQNGVIGADNKLLWHISEDLKNFKAITSGHPILMGRKTFESLGRPLPNRTNVVITRNTEFRADGITIMHSLEEAIALFPNEEEIFIIGGGEIYRQAITMVDKLYVTEVALSPEGDAHFPYINPILWQETQRELHQGFSFVQYARK